MSPGEGQGAPEDKNWELHAPSRRWLGVSGASWSILRPFRACKRILDAFAMRFGAANTSQMRLQLANASQALPSQTGGGRTAKPRSFGRPRAENHLR